MHFPRLSSILSKVFTSFLVQIFFNELIMITMYFYKFLHINIKDLRAINKLKFNRLKTLYDLKK